MSEVCPVWGEGGRGRAGIGRPNIHLVPRCIGRQTLLLCNICCRINGTTGLGGWGGEGGLFRNRSTRKKETKPPLDENIMVARRRAAVSLWYRWIDGIIIDNTVAYESAVEEKFWRTSLFPPSPTSLKVSVVNPFELY